MAALEAEMRVLAEQLQVGGWAGGLRGLGLGRKLAGPMQLAGGWQPCCEPLRELASPLTPAPASGPCWLLLQAQAAAAPDLTDEEMQQQNPLAALLRSMLPWVNLGQAPDAEEGGEQQQQQQPPQ